MLPRRATQTRSSTSCRIHSACVGLGSANGSLGSLAPGFAMQPDQPCCRHQHWQPELGAGSLSLSLSLSFLQRLEPTPSGAAAGLAKRTPTQIGPSEKHSGGVSLPLRRQVCVSAAVAAVNLRQRSRAAVRDAVALPPFCAQRLRRQSHANPSLSNRLAAGVGQQPLQARRCRIAGRRGTADF